MIELNGKCRKRTYRKANKKPYGNENNISMDKTKLFQIKVVLSTRTDG